MESVRQVANKSSFNARQHVGSSPTDGCDTLPAEESESSPTLTTPKWISPCQDGCDANGLSFIATLTGEATGNPSTMNCVRLEPSAAGRGNWKIAISLNLKTGLSQQTRRPLSSISLGCQSGQRTQCQRGESYNPRDTTAVGLRDRHVCRSFPLVPCPNLLTATFKEDT